MVRDVRGSAMESPAVVWASTRADGLKRSSRAAAARSRSSARTGSRRSINTLGRQPNFSAAMANKVKFSLFTKPLQLGAGQILLRGTGTGLAQRAAGPLKNVGAILDGDVLETNLLGAVTDGRAHHRCLDQSGGERSQVQNLLSAYFLFGAAGAGVFLLQIG